MACILACLYDALLKYLRRAKTIVITLAIAMHELCGFGVWRNYLLTLLATEAFCTPLVALDVRHLIGARVRVTGGIWYHGSTNYSTPLFSVKLLQIFKCVLAPFVSA